MLNMNMTKINFSVFIFLIISASMCYSSKGFSQDMKARRITLQHPFGIKDTSIHQITYEQILTNPILNYQEPNYEITEYKISFLPTKENYSGPYTIKGSSRIQGLPIDIIKRLKASKNKKTRVFIDDTHVKYNGESAVANTIIITCVP